MTHVRTNARLASAPLSLVAAVSATALVALCSSVLAATGGADAGSSASGSGNALIQKSGSSAAKPVIAAAPRLQVAAPAKPAAKKVEPPVKKTVVPPKKNTTSSKNSSSKSSSTSSGTTETQGNGQTQQQSAPQTSQAVAPTAAKKAIILSNLQPSDFFNDAAQQMGVEHVLILAQNNMDPDAKTTARVSGEKIVAAVKAERGPDASGWVMLDYELPFDDVFDNGKTDPRYAGMMQSMIDAVKYAKQQLPNCKFTYYGVPNIRYWITGGGWEAAPQWSQIQTMDGKFEVYKALVAELDWLDPCVYDRYDASKTPAGEAAAMAKREDLFRRKNVELCDRLRDAVGKPDMPIIPGVSLVYEGGGSGEVWQPISMAEFRADQVEPLLAAGADGVFLWSSLNYQAWVAGLSWVPTPGEAARSEARSVLTRLFFGGSTPANWSTNEAKAETNRRIATFLSNYAGAVRSAESSAAVAAGGGS